MLNGRKPVSIADGKSCNFNLEKFLATGRKLGIQATPTIFLASGERLRGAVSKNVLKEKLQITISVEK